MNDGCSLTCQVESGWRCSGISPSFCSRINIGPVCGDGVISGSESCDDSKTQSGDGCSSTCAVENGWTCTGAPSKCVQSASPATRGMKEISVSTNIFNVHIIIETDDLFIFNNESEMKSFMKYDFPNPSTLPTAAYCLQNIAQKKIFQCLLMYPSGIPIYEFPVDFSFNRQGKMGNLQVKVDPTIGGIASRSLL